MTFQEVMNLAVNASGISTPSSPSNAQVSSAARRALEVAQSVRQSFNDLTDSNSPHDRVRSANGKVRGSIGMVFAAHGFFLEFV